jgi:hypothetical protein
VATDIVPGQRADDPLYLPAITRVRESVGRRGLLDVGDCKMAALETRASLQAGGDFYLCPLAEIQRPPHVLEDYLGPVASGQQPLTRITRLTATGTRQHLADGYERLDLSLRCLGTPGGWNPCVYRAERWKWLARHRYMIYERILDNLQYLRQNV